MHNANRRLGQAAVAQLVADDEARLSCRSFMAKYDLGKGTVLGLLEQNGVVPPTPALTETEVTGSDQAVQVGPVTRPGGGASRP